MWKEEEYIQLLEDFGIDTVCFMGSGWNIEDVKVGSTFYFSYAFYGMSADKRREKILQHIISDRSILEKSTKLTDKFKIVSKFRFVNNQITNGKRREEYVVVENLRTGKRERLSDKQIDGLFYCIFDTID